MQKAVQIYKKEKVDKILVVCEKENIASAKVIQKNKGELEREWFDKRFNAIVQRWWIKV